MAEPQGRIDETSRAGADTPPDPRGTARFGAAYWMTGKRFTAGPVLYTNQSVADDPRDAATIGTQAE